MVHRRVAESAYRHFYYSKQKRKENLFNLKKREAIIFVLDVQLAVIVVLTCMKIQNSPYLFNSLCLYDRRCCLDNYDKTCSKTGFGWRFLLLFLSQSHPLLK
jgi:hypothetical protein